MSNAKLSLDNIFKQWNKNLIPVKLASKDGKKIPAPAPWKNGQIYPKADSYWKKVNSIGLRTGTATVNVIDIDTKDFSLITNSDLFDWIDDRMLYRDTLIVESKNGFHFYFLCDEKIKTVTKKGKNGIDLPYVDFRGEGGLVFIYSSTDIAEYTVVCNRMPLKIDLNVSPLAEILPTVNDSLESHPDANGFADLDNPEDATTVVISPYEPRTAEEVRELLSKVSSDTDRTTWMELLASAYNLTNEKDLIEGVCREWSETAESYTEDGFDQVWTQLLDGTYGKAFNGGMLIKLAKNNISNLQDAKYDLFLGKLEYCQDVKEIKDLFRSDEWKSEPHCTNEQIATLPKACSDRANVIYKDQGIARKAGVNIFKSLFPKKEVVNEEIIEPIPDIPGIDFYLCNNSYAVVKDHRLTANIYKQNLKPVGQSLGVSGTAFEEKAVGGSILIEGIKKETDYMIDSYVSHEVRASPTRTENPYLYLITNPLFGVNPYTENPHIIDDFFNKIWNGKAEDIIKIVALSIRFKELKLNKIHLVAPSNAGKTKFLENMNFKIVHMRRLVAALNGDKGIGINVINGLKETGLLLIDEANKPLTEEIKNIDGMMYVDQFGQGGTQEVRLHFTVLTSTHKQALRGMSDEMFNRILMIELTPSEIEYKLTDSPIFVEDRALYTDALIKYSRGLFRQTLIDPGYTKDDLEELQNKYRLESSIDDIGNILLDISYETIAILEAQSDMENGDVISKNGKHYIKRKTDLIKMFEDMLTQFSHIDKGKYAEVLANHFAPSDRVSVRIDKSPIKVYPLILKPYYIDKEEGEMAENISLFDDLDLEGWE